MSDRKTQEPRDFIHMWDVKLKATNEQTKNEQIKTHRHSQQFDGRQKGRGGRQ